VDNSMAGRTFWMKRKSFSALLRCFRLMQSSPKTQSLGPAIGGSLAKAIDLARQPAPHRSPRPPPALPSRPGLLGALRLRYRGDLWRQRGRQPSPAFLGRLQSGAIMELTRSAGGLAKYRTWPGASCFAQPTDQGCLAGHRCRVSSFDAVSLRSSRQGTELCC
jgi:hypothetical protein